MNFTPPRIALPGHKWRRRDGCKVAEIIRLTGRDKNGICNVVLSHDGTEDHWTLCDDLGRFSEVQSTLDILDDTPENFPLLHKVPRGDTEPGNEPVSWEQLTEIVERVVHIVQEKYGIEGIEGVGEGGPVLERRPRR